MLRGGLHQATLRQVSDADCAQVYKTNRPGTGERFNAARMRCAVDVDGKQPLNSGCFGDSGGALVVGTNEAPVQLGVVSWGGDRCGADHSPSRVRRRRSATATSSSTRPRPGARRNAPR